MAKQGGIITLTGNIENLNFYKTKSGYHARKKTGPTAEMIANGESYKRTRENMAEFARACTGGKSIRHAFRELIKIAKDGTAVSRLNQQLSKVIKSDLHNERGKRTILDGDLPMLEGFEFNQNAALKTALDPEITAAIDRSTGKMTVSIPGFVPLKKLQAPKGADHFAITCAGAELDFENDKSIVSTNTTGDLPYDMTATGDINLTTTVTPNSTLPLFLVLGIEYSQVVKGIAYPLSDKSFNFLKLVKVSVA